VVSVRKGCFFALAVSICGLACAAYLCTPPRNPLISLPGHNEPSELDREGAPEGATERLSQKIPAFRIRNQ